MSRDTGPKGIGYMLSGRGIWPIWPAAHLAYLARGASGLSGPRRIWPIWPRRSIWPTALKYGYGVAYRVRIGWIYIEEGMPLFRRASLSLYSDYTLHVLLVQYIFSHAN